MKENFFIKMYLSNHIINQKLILILIVILILIIVLLHVRCPLSCLSGISKVFYEEAV